MDTLYITYIHTYRQSDTVRSENREHPQPVLCAGRALWARGCLVQLIRIYLKGNSINLAWHGQDKCFEQWLLMEIFWWQYQSASSDITEQILLIKIQVEVLNYKSWKALVNISKGFGLNKWLYKLNYWLTLTNKHLIKQVTNLQC